MGLYAKYLLPRIVHCVCGSQRTMEERRKLVPMARGRVLEVGIGSGLNIDLYDPARVERIWGIDPSLEMWRIAQRAMRERPVEVQFIRASAERIPLRSGSVDSVVVTYTLCTIPDVPASLDEIRRVLRPGGELLFCEHGEAPDRSVRRWQRWANPVWSRLGGGCRLDTPVPGLLDRAGFTIRRLESAYLPGWKPASFVYRGAARVAG